MAMFPPTGVKPSAEDYGFTYGSYFLGAFLILLAGFLWALVGGVAASALKNRYMAYAVPFIIYYVLSSFQTRYFQTAYMFNPREWIYPGHLELETAVICALLAVAAAGIAYYLVMKRRLRDV
jgi:drug/metabolite transporter (DMT)-like permease